ncbi:tetratricopeptide repeat protein [Pseudochryseolinea flava]|uniref:MalT-like TPR region domain-containing protein n=1 Tax=Pseudochryseolinea flava TaxID=2059302 RepID=A0A364Y4I2_9BACT|nr:tetratricopeptide repeat protein [Pseudochryseolinea flava]RAW01659.1 hypothetical protein DQQ10_08370 [Pseudochryseolinea flava]
MNAKVIACALLLTVNLSIAQTKLIDSLRSELNKTPEKDRYALYIDLGYKLSSIDPVVAKDFARKAYELAHLNYDSVAIINSRMLIGLLLKIEDPDSSLVIGIKTLAMAEKCQMNRQVYIAMNRNGIIYLFLGKYDRALDCFLKALDLPYVKSNRRAQKMLWNNLGLLYYKIRYYEKALSAYGESLKHADSIAEPGLVAETLLNMSLCESSLKNFQKSNGLIDRGFKICPNDCLDVEGIYYFHSLTVFHFLQGNYDSALHFTNRAYELASRYHDRRMQASSLELKATAYLKLGQVHLAETTILESESILSGSELHAEIRDIYAALAKIAERKGDYKTMAMALKKYTEELDITEATASRVNIMKLEVDLKEREHREQLLVQEMYLKAKEEIISTQRLLIIAVIVICILFSILLVVFIKRHRKKTQHNKLLDKNLQLRTNELHDEMRSAFKAQLFQRELVDKMLVDIDHQMTSMKALLKFISSDETQRDACIKKSETLFLKIETCMRKIKTVISDGAEIHK